VPGGRVGIYKLAMLVQVDTSSHGKLYTQVSLYRSGLFGDIWFQTVQR